MAKVIDIRAAKDQQEQEREDWHGRKLTKMELNSLTWEDKKKIVMDTVLTIPIPVPQMWEDWSGVPADLFVKWKYKVDMERFGRPMNLGFGMNKGN